MTFNFKAFKSAKVHLYDLNQIFEDRFIFEEGAYREDVTDEKINMDQKDIQITAIHLYHL